MKYDRRANNSKLFLFYVAFALFGYCLVAPIAEIISPISEVFPLTHLYRMIILGSALVFIFQVFFIKKTYIDIRGRCIFSLLLIFWMIYTCRLVFDAMFQKELLAENTIISYVTLSYFIVFIPLLSLARSYNETDLKYLFQVSFYILLLGILFTLSIEILQIFNSNGASARRFSGERLNPISLGRYSAVLFTLAFGSIKMQHERKLLLVLGMFVGIAGVLLSGSRGALVSLLLVLIAIVLLNISFKKIIWLSILLPLSAGAVIFFMSVLMPDLDVINNYLATGGERDQSAQIRYQLYWGALEQFYNNPILGDLIIEREYKFYPHNHILEILMATGITGLLVFITFNLFAFRKLNSLNISSLSDVGAWETFRYCVLFYLVAGMFSGTIFGAVEYWYLMVIICFGSNRYRPLV